jgi:NADH dehydrogenase
VTGAFSFTGRFITTELLARGRLVRTLTNHPSRPGRLLEVETAPLQFTDRQRLLADLTGVETLYNTYWIRYPQVGTTFDRAVANIAFLAEAARAAGVAKIVHVSVSNPSITSRLAYYRGKAEAEEVIKQSGIDWSIVRPTLIFGQGDILLNNIAWLLRHLPIFFVPGDGSYRLQPVSGPDVARICLAAGNGLITDAAGPEIMSYRDLTQRLAATVGVSRPVFEIPPKLALASLVPMNLILRDTILVKEELDGLMGENLVSSEPAIGTERLGDFLESVRDTIGRAYASEMARHVEGLARP